MLGWDVLTPQVMVWAMVADSRSVNYLYALGCFGPGKVRVYAGYCRFSEKKWQRMRVLIFIFWVGDMITINSTRGCNVPTNIEWIRLILLKQQWKPINGWNQIYWVGNYYSTKFNQGTQWHMKIQSRWGDVFWQLTLLFYYRQHWTLGKLPSRFCGPVDISSLQRFKKVQYFLTLSTHWPNHIPHTLTDFSTLSLPTQRVLFCVLFILLIYLDVTLFK
jgi:hypothetical protein